MYKRQTPRTTCTHCRQDTNIRNDGGSEPSTKGGGEGRLLPPPSPSLIVRGEKNERSSPFS
jgi:hypothetical protein